MLEPNSILQDRYRIIRQIGGGGMGTIYEAIDQRVNRRVVLKRATHESEYLLEAFKREAHLLANLRHQALPKVTDHFSEGRGHYLVMDFIPGDNLEELLAMFGRPFPLKDVLRWADELLKVLEYLHRHNPPILHRDIKPSNLKLTRDGEIFLLDFGLAKGATGMMSTVNPSARSVAGYTPSYAPLEQILRTDSLSADNDLLDLLRMKDPARTERFLQIPTDGRSDLYSLGVTLYHLITNERPYSASTRAKHIWDGQSDPLRPAKDINPLVPVEISDLLDRAMALDPDARPPAAAIMREQFRVANLNLTLTGVQINLQQLSKEALDAVVRLALEQLSKKVEPQLAQTRTELEQAMSEVMALHHREVKALRREMDSLSAILKDYTKPGGPVALENIEPKVIESIARLAAEQSSKKVVEEIAWEVVPQLAEQVFKRSVEEGKIAAASQPPPAVKTIDAKPATPVADSDVPVKQTFFDIDRLPIEVPEEEKRLHNDARRFARLLVSEIKLYNEQKVQEGRSQGDIYERLRDDIDRSRQMYDKRVAPPVAARYDYFHHELINTLAAGDPNLMGRSYLGEQLRRW